MMEWNVGRQCLQGRGGRLGIPAACPCDGSGLLCKRERCIVIVPFVLYVRPAGR